MTDWWQGFNDPALNQLVVEALSEGPDVQLAVSRVREARALSYSTITQFLPQLTATGSGHLIANAASSQRTPVAASGA